MTPSEIQLDEWVRLGGMAPSGGNSQPWRVALVSGSLELRLDPTRASSFLDVAHTASIFATGCFTENVCLAAAVDGWSVDVTVHELDDVAQPLATLRFRRALDARRDSLYDQIASRRTNRRWHEGPALSDAVIERLRTALGTSANTRISTLTELAQKRHAAAQLGKADAILIRHSQLFRGILSELRWTQAEAVEKHDGVAISTLEMPPAVVKLLRVLRAVPALRRLLPMSALEKMAELPLLNCSHLCLMSVRGELSSTALVASGRAAQRLWLMATKLGLSLQPLAALSFLLLRVTRFGGVGLSRQQCRELQLAADELRGLFALNVDEFPLFPFRLSRTAPASDRALRLQHHRLYLRT
jgi:hypothetical protein